MATITPTPVGSDFNTALFNFLKTPGIEGFVPFVYNDSVGLPTLGVGYLLLEKDLTTKVWKPIDLALLQNTVGLTDTQINTLTESLNAAAAAKNNVPGAINPFPDWYAGLPATANIHPDWTITDGQALALFNNIIETYKTTVKTWMGDDVLYASLQGSKEMLVLVSLAYNGYLGAGHSPALHKAIVDDGNRAEAWYELRYATPGANKGRYYAQANLFNLYDPGPVTRDEAFSIYRMYTAHRDTITTYENDYPPSGKNISEELLDAAKILVAEYSQYIENPIRGGDNTIITTNIQVTSSGIDTLWGEDSANNPHHTGSANDLLIGSEGQTDYLYGYGGSDVLVGGSGNDVLFGEKGDDLLVGGDGNDVILGGDNNDTLYGDFDSIAAQPGNDYLDGGSGDDTIYGNEGDDIIIGGAEGQMRWRYFVANDEIAHAWRIAA